MYQHKVDVDMPNAVKSVLALALCQSKLYGIQHIHINLTLIHSMFYRYADVLTGTSIPLYIARNSLIELNSPLQGTLHLFRELSRILVEAPSKVFSFSMIHIPKVV